MQIFTLLPAFWLAPLPKYDVKQKHLRSRLYELSYMN